MTERRSWWGWGYEGQPIDEASFGRLLEGLQRLLGIGSFVELEPPAPESVILRRPRIELPGDLAAFCSDGHLDRLSHAYGKAFVDVLRAVRGEFPNPPDFVAYPNDEDEIKRLFAFCESEGVALVPFGGGSSVVRGLEPPAGSGYRAAITVDMRHFDRVLEVEPVSRSVHVEAGMFGPALEAALEPHDLTLRHFPQSFEFSTVGGWIATRAGGHRASGPTRIDDFVSGVRMLTPRGVLETRRSPSSGAGHGPERLVLGSEGTLGVISSAWLRIQPKPRHRVGTTVHFADTDRAFETARTISQADLWPANCRLLSPLEAALTGVGDGHATELLLGFESHDHPVDDRLGRALEICDASGGRWETSSDGDRETTAEGRWRRSFLQAPYIRDRLVLKGVIVETFETAVPWDGLSRLQENVLAVVGQAIHQGGGRGFVTWRLSYVYPDGPAPYYTVVAVGDRPGGEVERWMRIKEAASEAVVGSGGTITHHHGVGRDHRDWMARERGDLWREVLASVKGALDPAWILNPAVLIAPGAASTTPTAGEGG